MMMAAAAQTVPHPDDAPQMDSSSGADKEEEAVAVDSSSSTTTGVPARKSSSTTAAATKKIMGLPSAATPSSDPLASSLSSSTTTTTAITALKPLEAALDFWTRLDLAGAHRVDLEKQGRELKEAKESTIKNRKRLAEATKEWKKKGSSTGAEDLLKAYQEEIDNLTRRAKGADAAFAGVYQALYDAPDPTPLLTTALSDRRATVALELELGRLAREVEEYETEFCKLKNQDVTIRRLQEKLAAYEKGAAGDMAASVEAARAEIQALAEARVREAMEREQRLEVRLKVAQEAQAVAEEGRARAQAEVVEVARQAEERAAAMGAEGELLAQERERHEAEAAALRRELKAAVAAAKRGNAALNGSSSTDGPVSPSSSAAAAGKSSNSSSKFQALQTELEEMGASLAAVRQRLLVKEEEWTQAQARVQETAAGLEKELQGERAARAKVEEEMRGRPSVEEVARLRAQIRLLQQLEFNGAEEEEGEGGREGGGLGGTTMAAGVGKKKRRRQGAGEEGELVGEEEGKAADGKEEAEKEGAIVGSSTPSVGHLLMGRLRRMETEVMTSRRKVAELEGERARLEEEKRAAEAEVQGQVALVARLEEDLARVAAKGSGGGGGEEAASAVGGLVLAVLPSSSSRLEQQQQQQHCHQEAGEALEVDMHELLTTAAHVVPSSSSSSASSSSSSTDLVQILQAQRDRYKARVRTLEGELAAAGQEVGRCKAQAEAMLRDNLTLYEKVRFLQSYGSGRSAGSSGPGGRQLLAAASTGPSPLHQRSSHHGGGVEAMLEAGGAFPTGAEAAATEARYRSMYEEQMNPFKAFSAAERVRKVQDLNVVDRIALETTRAFLASKTARLAVFVYAVSLHVLVFLTLYMWGHHHCADLHYHGDSLMSVPPDARSLPGSGGGGEVGGGGMR